MSFRFCTERGKLFDRSNYGCNPIDFVRMGSSNSGIITLNETRRVFNIIYKRVVSLSTSHRYSNGLNIGC